MHKFGFVNALAFALSGFGDGFVGLLFTFRVAPLGLQRSFGNIAPTADSLNDPDLARFVDLPECQFKLLGFGVKMIQVANECTGGR